MEVLLHCTAAICTIIGCVVWLAICHFMCVLDTGSWGTAEDELRSRELKGKHHTKKHVKHLFLYPFSLVIEKRSIATPVAHICLVFRES